MKLQLLAADIGGTNCRFAKFALSEQAPALLDTLYLKTNDYQLFSEIVDTVLRQDFAKQIDQTVIAAAGPVIDNSLCDPPNINWQINLDDLSDSSQLGEITLVNDFYAEAHAIKSPVGVNAKDILPGSPSDSSTVSVIGAGTGLGKAIVVNDTLVLPSEGGHSSFAIEREEEYPLYEFLLKKLNGRAPTWEDVVSGVGISRICEFISGEDLPPAEAISSDSEVLSWFSRFYARAIRNFALESLSLGGVYVSGGVARRNPQIFELSDFTEEFYRSAKYSKMLRSIPVRFIWEENSGLWGAAYFSWYRSALAPQVT